MYTNIYRAVYGPCTWPVYTAVYWPCIWRVHGLVTAVYTYACVHGCVHGHERAAYTAAYGPCWTVLTDVYVLCTGTRAVYTARAQCVSTILFAKDTVYQSRSQDFISTEAEVNRGSRGRASSGSRAVPLVRGLSPLKPKAIQ